MSEATFTFRVDKSLKDQFTAAVKDLRQVQAGLDSANAGKLVPADEVEARFAAKRAATRLRLQEEK